MSSDVPVTPPDEDTAVSGGQTPKADQADGVETAPTTDTSAPQEPQAPPEPASEPGDAASDAAAEKPAGEQDVPETGPEAEAAEPPVRRDIQIGSRRGPEGAKSSLPDMPIPKDMEIETEGAESLERALPPEPKQVVPTPSRRDPLPPELAKQLDEAMADVSLDAIVSDPAAEASQPLEMDARLSGRIVRIHGDNAFFALGGRNEGVASVRLFREPPSVGDELEVVIKGFHAEDGIYDVRVPGASVAVSDWSDLSEGTIVDARITGANTGGLECMVANIRGFIPASQIGIFRVEDFAEYIGQKLPCVATEVNRKRKNLVLSHRAVLEREKQEARQQLIEALEPGETREGVVRSLQDFGAFVDIGGIDGMVHISQLSWERVNHPNEVLTEGQKIQVKIERVNKQTGKIALSYRELLEHPWHDVDERFPADSLLTGTVSRIAKFGAFVKLAPGVEGLVHISELAHYRVRQVSDVVAEGQEVSVKVLSVDADSQRIALSLKAALPEPTPEEKPQEEEAAHHREQAVSKRRGPLKGGVDRPSGGEQFGLKW